MKPIFIILSCVLIAAHCLRLGVILLVLLCLAAPCLLLFRSRWAARLLQGFLVLAGAEWGRTLWVLASERWAADRPWIRMAAILATVAVLTFLSAWLARPHEAGNSVKERSE